MEIGEPAVTPLVEVLKGKTAHPGQTACAPLEKIGGVRVAAALTDLLSEIPASEYEPGRWWAAKILVKLYQSGRLDDESRRRIIEMKKTIQSTRWHTDIDSCPHDDSASSMEFEI